ncbi:dTDP-glucose 4,6-dehydratase [Sphaerisporangium sp. TRM90804]|uniref:dTDP-glucose 4,6-dehydratase n=1 Tax=Sphaerisporangium sp. TRM90804 TaxID=3031113 RepID=UPI00244D3013|nr:dTDP-glucose 4,6-dehydratase [Sphaerisporangium sp. TRM90804]MDH2427207.1 dTDP-glucose 4,6-dehydratase [Sphaerisporangium sp. TRM90804]
MRLFVTGGAGFIGSHYVNAILAGRYPGTEDAHVTVLDKLTYAGNLDNLGFDPFRLTFVRGDICDEDLVMSLLPGHDAVVHFAAESHVDRSITGAAAFARTNVLGTQVLLDCARRAGVGRFVHVSTDEVYGSIDHTSWTESWPLSPNSPYAASKAASDLLVQAYHRTHGLATSVTRCSNNYGTHQFPEKIIPLFITNLLDGQDIPLYGDGMNVREWLHVSDHCRAVHLVLTHGAPGEIYNVGGGRELSNRELAERLLDGVGASWDRVRWVADRKGHDRRYSLDSTKIEKELGFAPEVPFERGLADTVRWYRDNRWWWEPVKKRAELEAAWQTPGRVRAGA